MKTPILVAGLPGKMAAEVATLVADSADLRLFETGVTSPIHEGETASFGASSIELIGADSLPGLALPADTMAVDYTTPDAALGNLRWYAEQGVPFVIGTTGFDLREAQAAVAASETSAVIAPNMAPPIVLLQAAGEYLASQFPRRDGRQRAVDPAKAIRRTSATRPARPRRWSTT